MPASYGEVRARVQQIVGADSKRVTWSRWAFSGTSHSGFLLGVQMIEETNTRAKRLRDALRACSSGVAEPISAHELSKLAPFYGYVEIEISGAHPFVMFSNNDDFVAQRYFWHGADSYEGTSLRIWVALASRASQVLDVGSYSGIYSLAAASINSKCKVSSFEALDRVYARLKINQKVNQFGNIRTFNRVVTDFEGDEVLDVFSGDGVLVTASTTVRGVTDRPVHEGKHVRAVSLDDLFKRQELKGADLIKIDVEGAEDKVFCGARRLIYEKKPDILCEFLEGADCFRIEELLAPLGYQYYQIDEGAGECRRLEHIVPNSEERLRNFLLTTKSYGKLSELIGKDLATSGSS